MSGAGTIRQNSLGVAPPEFEPPVKQRREWVPIEIEKRGHAESLADETPDGRRCVTPQCGLRTCTKCRVLKPVETEFRLRADGRVHSWCVSCKRAHDRSERVLAERRRP